MAVNYFKKIGARRLLIMIMGNVFLGMGISIFKLSGLGNDPFSGMVMALANILGFRYASFLLVINGGLFIFELAAGRRLIGIGTLVNAFLLGYIVTFFNAVDATYVHTYRGKEFKSTTAGSGFRIAEHDADFFAKLVDKDNRCLGFTDGSSQLS